MCRQSIAILLAVCAAAAAPSTSAAEPAFRCAGLLPSATRTPAYTRAAGEARCEGFFDGTVSQPFIELLSLTRQRPDALPAAAAASSPTALSIQVAGGAGVQVVVQPLRPSPFYRVDAALATGQPLAWNATTMLASTGLRIADLGFLARAPRADAPPGSSTVARVTPISLAALPLGAAKGATGASASAASASAAGASAAGLSAAGAAASGGATASASAVRASASGASSASAAAGAQDKPAAVSAYAVLRVSVAVESVAARSYPAGQTGGGEWRKLPGSRLDAWDTVVLPITLSGDSTTETQIDVRAVAPGGQLLPLLQFIVTGR